MKGSNQGGRTGAVLEYRGREKSVRVKNFKQTVHVDCAEVKFENESETNLLLFVNSIVVKLEIINKNK